MRLFTSETLLAFIYSFSCNKRIRSFCLQLVNSLFRSRSHKAKMPRVPLVFNKTYSTPRRPYEKERLDQELELIGKFGLRNKREVWRVRYTLAKIRKAARELLTLDEKEPKRLFEGSLADSDVAFS